jgi:hypothetical protein
MRIFKMQSVGPKMGRGTQLRMRCPACRQQGTFDQPDEDFSFLATGGPAPHMAGVRVCPGANCRAIVLAVFSLNQAVVSYPAERIDFDDTKIPASISAALTEAITCHAQECHIAAAIMVRKTLEQLCEEKGAQGSNLKQRLKALGSSVLIPPTLVDAMEHLRLLGNDAAHVEAKIFAQIGDAELKAAIALTKEILKAVYQYEDLLAQLAALKTS